MIRRPALALVAGIAIAAGCANLPPIQPACGNGVLEPGEDCDTPSARCQACGWTCDSNRDCSDIPAPRDGAAYACGADGFCHAAGGVIGDETSAQPFPADRVLVTDVDHDRIGDAVGISVTSIATRAGDTAGQLASERDTLTPGAAGEAAILDLDRDGTSDIMLPTRDGLVAYASPQDTITPYAIAIELPDGVKITERAVVPIDGKRLVILVDDPERVDRLAAGIVDISAPALSVTPVQLCDTTFTPEGFDPSSVDYYLTTAPGGKPTVELSFLATNAAGMHEACAVAVVETPATPTTPISYDVDHTPALAAPTTRPVFAVVDGSGCPSSVISDSGPANLVRYVPSTGTYGECWFAGAMQPIVAIPGASTDIAVGRVRLDPPMSGLAPDALVTTGGVWGIPLASGAPAPLYLADHRLTAASSGDIDRDGLLDGVATGEDDTIDVLYRTVAPEGFQRVRLATHAPPQALTIGDFDGNGAADIAYVERGSGGDALMIAYGTADRPLPAAEVAGFGSLRALAPIQLVDSDDPFDQIADLGVVEQRAGYSAVAGFHGSPDRTLIPFLDPPGATQRAALRAATGGHFVAGSTQLDLLAIETADAATGTGDAALWLLAGADPGAISLTVPPFTSASGEIAIPPQPGGMPTIGVCAETPSELCIDGSRLVDWPTTATDLVVAIDPTRAQAMVLDPGKLSFGPMAPALGALVLTPLCPAQGPCLMTPGTALRAVFAADVDGDGTNELVIAFGRQDASAPGGVLACSVAASGLTCRDLVAEAGLPGTCRDAAPGRFALVGQARGAAGAAPVDLAVLCDSTIERVYHVAGEPAARLHHAPLVTLAIAPGDIRAITAGDVTGDAVDDLLVLATDQGVVPRLHVYPQRSSREVGR